MIVQKKHLYDVLDVHLTYPKLITSVGDDLTSKKEDVAILRNYRCFSQ